MRTLCVHHPCSLALHSACASWHTRIFLSPAHFLHGRHEAGSRADRAVCRLKRGRGVAGGKWALAQQPMLRHWRILQAPVDGLTGAAGMQGSVLKQPMLKGTCCHAVGDHTQQVFI